MRAFEIFVACSIVVLIPLVLIIASKDRPVLAESTSPLSRFTLKKQGFEYPLPEVYLLKDAATSNE